MYWASEIEWPVVRHSRDKKIKGCFERVRLCALRVARRVWQLSQYVNVSINEFSSFLKVLNYDSFRPLNPLKPKLNPICYLLELLAHHFLHVSRIRVKSLTFR